MVKFVSKQAVYILFVLSVASCNKSSEPVVPPAEEMTYMDLNNREIKYNNSSAVIDLNKDNQLDIVFNVITVGDPINQVDKMQYRIGSGILTKLPVNIDEEVPVMNKTDSIFVHDFNGYHWYELSSIILIERVQHVSGVISWQGSWKNARRNYLPVQLVKDGQKFNGWVELSVDIPNEKIILHKSAISKKAEKHIRAGL